MKIPGFRFAKGLLQHVLAAFGLQLVRAPHRSNISNIFTDYEFRTLVDQMDRGDFDFDEETRRKLMQGWHLNNTQVPYPTIIQEALDRGDALTMNSLQVMELTYRAPYALAFEEACLEWYSTLIQWAETKGVQFDYQLVADIGCGLGGCLNLIASRYKPSKMYGVECASSAIDQVSSNRSYIIGIVADIESPKETFRSVCKFEADVVICMEVLEHLRHPERAFENLLSVKKEGGVLIVTAPNGRADQARQHINFWSPESWQSFIENAASVPTHTVIIDRLSNLKMPGGFHNVALIR